MNEQQQRAISLLDKLLKQEKCKQKVKKGEDFLPSSVVQPKWDHTPEQWAHDWCKGWAYQPDFCHADALGVELAERKQKMFYYDEKGEKVPDKDNDGNIKTNKKGQVQYKSWSKKCFAWVQSTAFDVRKGYTFYDRRAAKEEDWGSQLNRLHFAIQVTDANPATPGGAKMDRDSGSVTFNLLQNQNGTLVKIQELTTTQDDFVRFLITGSLISQAAPAIKQQSLI